jgi:uncharacterized protein (TIGR04141 family)
VKATRAARVPRQRNGHGTRLMTLYRLMQGTRIDQALDYVGEAAQRLDLRLDFPDVLDVPAVFVHAKEPDRVPDWCSDARRTTGIDLDYETSRAGGVLFLEVDGTLYAATYGSGFTWLDDAVKDQRFGLSFVVRCLDPDEIVDVVRRTPGAKGRTDSTLVPGGTSVHLLRIDRYAEMVRKLGGRTTDVPVRFSKLGTRPVSVEGSAGIRMRFATDPAGLIADIRAVAEVLRTQPVRPDLVFVENIVPVTSVTTSAQLDDQLELLLAAEPGTGDGLSVAVPVQVLDQLPQARLFRVKIGSAPPRGVTEVRLDDVLGRTWLQPEGHRVEALRAGWIEMFSSSDGREPLARTPALRWIEASVSLGERRFVLLDGEWYELGAGYLEQLRKDVERLLTSPGTVTLPGWRRDSAGKYEEEKAYNDRVADGDPRFVRLDRRLVQTQPGRSSGIEICDLLGPGEALVHVKKASSSAPLSHLFAQGLVSAQALFLQPDVRRDFAELVRRHGRGRTVPPDFTPKKVVFGILLKDGEDLTVDTLFPFAQVMLCQAAADLEGRGVVVEVVGIRAEQA